MCKILLSINPKHVENIFNGKKEYEYRKIQCTKNVDGIVIYSTSPVKQVVGEAKVEMILKDKPEKIWEMTKKKSGISKKFFKQYYNDSLFAVAYKLYDIVKYDTPKSLYDYGISTAPQSFRYLT